MGDHLGISSSSHLCFLASPWPSWGSPQLPQAFLGKSPASSLPYLGGSPVSPGPSWEPTVMEGIGNQIPGSHTTCCQLVPYNSAYLLESKALQGPGLSNSISCFAPTFWVPW